MGMCSQLKKAGNNGTPPFPLPSPSGPRLLRTHAVPSNQTVRYIRAREASKWNV